MASGVTWTINDMNNERNGTRGWPGGEEVEGVSGSGVYLYKRDRLANRKA
jgi:hypothetical protein